MRCIAKELIPFLLLSQRRLHPIKLQHTISRYASSPGYSADLSLRRTRRFFPSGGRNHRQYLVRRPTDGWPGRVGLIGLENTGMIDPPKVVTNPGTNRARRSFTSLM